MIHCDDFLAGRCRSCRLLDQPYADQLINKQINVQQAFADFQQIEWLPVQASPAQGFRNKAKMVVSGHWQSPVLGLSLSNGHSVDLSRCPLYPEPFQTVFHHLSAWITLCQLMPYSVVKRTGELKFVLVSYSQSTQSWMIRWVLRSHRYLAVMRENLPNLLAMLPNNVVVSVNIQPIDMAILEGEEEILLTEKSSITYLFNDIPLYCRPKSFFQTNDVVASQLYRQVQDWVKLLDPKSVWDLFCGVGGFALHIAHVLPQATVTGIEVSSEAITSANISAESLGCRDRTHFRSLTAQEFSLNTSVDRQLPNGIIVNPPRRGLGQVLCHFLNEAIGVDWLIYSSCHRDSLLSDIIMLPNFIPVKARVFDMFPHTDHVEILVLLVRASDGDKHT